MRASGQSGRLRFGYHVAADLGPWRIEQQRDRFAFVARAEVRTEHEFYATQRPVDLVLDLGPVEWIWRDVRPSRDGREIVVAIAERPIVEPRAVAAV